MITNSSTIDIAAELEALRAEVIELRQEKDILMAACQANEDRRHWHPDQDKRKQTKIGRPRNPNVYSYVRVSHQDSVESGLGIAGQVETFERWWSYQKSTPQFSNARRGGYGWRGGMVSKYAASMGGYAIPHPEGRGYDDGIFMDLGVSAYQNPFIKRPAGAKLSAILKPGDIVVIPRMDRGFRNLRDFANTHDRWAKQGIGIVFVDPDLNLSTAVGLLTAQILSAVAQFYSSSLSERNQEVCKQRMAKGLMPNRNVPAPGFKFSSKFTKKKTVPDWAERRYISLILKLRNEQELSWAKISDEIERIRAVDENRAPRRTGRLVHKGQARKWSDEAVQRIYNQQHTYPVSPLFENEQ